MNFELLFLAAAFYGFYRYILPFHRETKNKNKLPWGGWEAVGIVLFIYYFAQLFGGIIATVIAALQGKTGEAASQWLQGSPVGQFAIIFFVELITLGLLYFFLRRRNASFKTLGLKGKPSWKDAGYVLLGFAAYFLLYIVVVNTLKALIPGLDVQQEQEVGFETAKGLSLIFVFLSLVVLPPVTEEIVTRGFLYTGLRQQFAKPLLAALLTSALFGVAHLQAGLGKPLLWIAAIDTFVLSMVLIGLREKTRDRLWAPIGLHVLKNLIAFVTLFVFHAR